jgi:hypothetical protein
MSDPSTPETPLQPEGDEPSAVIPAEEAPASGGGSGTRRTAIVVLVALVVSAVLGGGAFAVYKVFFDGGPQPADVLPASTVAVLSIDLDPSAGQKIEALKSIRKFPQLKEDLGLDPTDDLRRYFVEEALDCDGLDFDADVKPWIGKRAAVAAVDLGDDTPVPVLALQITDQKKADTGFEQLAECSEEDLGYVTGTDYLIVSDSAEHAEAGDQGVVNFYLAERAAGYLVDGLESLTEGFLGGAGEDFGGSVDDSGYLELEPGMAGESAPPAAADECVDATDDPFAALKDQLEDFEGLAGTIRFADGGMELSVATGGFAQLGSEESVGAQIGALPADTALAAGLAVPPGYAKDLVEQFSCDTEGPDLIAGAEEETGLDLPDDLATLLGSALTLSVGGDAPDDLTGIEGPGDLPVGLALHGDAEAIEGVIARVEEHLGTTLEDAAGVGIESSDSLVVLSPSEDYADTLLGKGGLGSSDDFQDAVPEADRSAAVFYLDFDGEWREALLGLARDTGVSESDLEVAEQNTEPLKSLGISSWVEDGASHVLLKLSTR